MACQKVCALFVVCAIIGSSLADSPPIPYATTSGVETASFHGEPFDGYTVQSGYDEYLIPDGEHGLLALSGGAEVKGHRHAHHHWGHVANVLRHVVSAARKAIPKVATAAVVLIGLFLIGGCLNAVVCSFTPFCAISLGPGFVVSKDTFRSYLDPDRISTTATYVMDAIKKYRDMYERLSNEIDGGKKIKRK